MRTPYVVQGFAMANGICQQRAKAEKSYKKNHAIRRDSTQERREPVKTVNYLYPLSRNQ